MAKVRIYGKELNRWEDGYREIAYKEYDSETCEVVGAGTEDFSLDRWKLDTDSNWVWVWKGALNRGGHRRFEDIGFVRYRKSNKKQVKEFFNNKYKAKLTQLR